MTEEKKRPLLLLTNDDGLGAPGLDGLIEGLADLGEICVVAPDRNRSGISHGVSLLVPLRCTEVEPMRWQTTGTPSDCVYLAIHELIGRQPDLVISGINNGQNLSYDVHYSGTTGGAVEGTLNGVPSIAMSLVDSKNGSYQVAARFARSLAAHVLEHGLPRRTTLNVNVPAGNPTGHQITFLGHRTYTHSVVKKIDPRGAPYYWIGGEYAEAMEVPGSDCTAIAQGLISVTPLDVDMTDMRSHHALDSLSLFESKVTPSVESPPGWELESHV